MPPEQLEKVNKAIVKVGWDDRRRTWGSHLHCSPTQKRFRRGKGIQVLERSCHSLQRVAIGNRVQAVSKQVLLDSYCHSQNPLSQNKSPKSGHLGSWAWNTQSLMAPAVLCPHISNLAAQWEHQFWKKNYSFLGPQWEVGGNVGTTARPHGPIRCIWIIPPALNRWVLDEETVCWWAKRDIFCKTLG